MQSSRRNFIKTAAVTAAAAVCAPATGLHASETESSPAMAPDALIVPRGAGLKITGTFLDEISHDIPHQNWGVEEWNEIFDGIHDVVDACAFQDGHLYNRYREYFGI